MITGGAVTIRARLAQLFRRGSQDEQVLALDAHDNDARALAGWARAADFDPDAAHELARAEQQLTQEWAHRLSEYVTSHPGARSDLKALAELGTVSNTGGQQDTGAGTFVNGTVVGGVHNHYHGENR